MAQGKAWDKKKVIEVLEPIFKLGYSVTKACNTAGFPQSTIQTWIDKDEELRLKITSWQNEPNLLARKNWIQAIEDGIDKKKNDTYTPAKEWLERKEKDEFSTRTDITSDGDKIQGIDVGSLLEKAYGDKSDISGKVHTDSEEL